MEVIGQFASKQRSKDHHHHLPQKYSIDSNTKSTHKSKDFCFPFSLENDDRCPDKWCRVFLFLYSEIQACAFWVCRQEKKLVSLFFYVADEGGNSMKISVDSQHTQVATGSSMPPEVGGWELHAKGQVMREPFFLRLDIFPKHNISVLLPGMELKLSEVELR